MESTPMTLTPSEKRANVSYMRKLARRARVLLREDSWRPRGIEAWNAVMFSLKAAADSMRRAR
jgi:hypothetical protein